MRVGCADIYGCYSNSRFNIMLGPVYTNYFDEDM